MKNILVTFFLSLVCLCTNGMGTNFNIINWHDLDPYVYHSVSSTNGLILGIGSWPESIGYNDKTLNAESPFFISFSLPGSGKAVYIPLNEYLGQFNLYDTNNRPLPKTQLGSSFKLGNDLHWNEKIVRQNGSGEATPWNVHDGWSRTFDLPSPSELFEIKKPGTYRLVLEIQVFLKTGINKDLVRFPPLEIPIIKP